MYLKCLFMDLLLEFGKESLAKIKEILLNDDVVSRASIIFKDGSMLGYEDKYFCYIYGTEEQIERAKELVKDLAKESENKEEIIKKIKEEEERANIGFGAIFG